MPPILLVNAENYTYISDPVVITLGDYIVLLALPITGNATKLVNKKIHMDYYRAIDSAR
jgi:hypothetical protein